MAAVGGIMQLYKINEQLERLINDGVLFVVVMDWFVWIFGW